LTCYGQSQDGLCPEMLPYCDNELVDRKKRIKRSPCRKLIEWRLKNQYEKISFKREAAS